MLKVRESDRRLKARLNSLVRPKVFWPSIIILLIASVTFYIFKEKEKSLRIYTQEQLSETINAKKVVKNELEETIGAKKLVEQKLVTEEQRSLALEKQVQEKEEQIKIALDKLEKEIDVRRQAEAQLLVTMKDMRALQQEIKQLVKEPKTVELEKIVIKAKPVIVGRVIAVDKEQAFIVVNLGEADDLRLGDILSVYRSEEFIGSVQVEQLKEEISAAAILSEWLNTEFKENDEVRGI